MITQDIIIGSNSQFPVTHRSPLIHLVDHALESGSIDGEVLVLQGEGRQGICFCVGVQDAEIDGEGLGGGPGGRGVEEEG
jgi:hypothetical protein